MRKITIRDIAREAGVSPSTVSRVINNSAPVSKELKERVLSTIKKLGYNPNPIAQSLRKGFTNTIGFIIPDITNPFFSLIVKGAEEYLKRKKMFLIVCNSNHSVKEEERLLQTLMERKTDGLLFIGAGNRNKIISTSLDKMKIVFVDRVYEKCKAPYVVSNNYKGMKNLIDYLVDTGHKSFVFLNGEKNTYSAKERLRGFLDALKEHKIEEYEVVFGQFTYESGFALAKGLKKIPDAIVCGNDLMAYGAIDALEERGYKVPDDVSVTGFDDLPFSKHYKPSLTTVRQPFYEMGYEAAKILYRLINSKPNIETNVVLETKLVIRETTKPKGGRR